MVKEIIIQMLVNGLVVMGNGIIWHIQQLVYVKKKTRMAL